jgi:hypothetical protein
LYEKDQWEVGFRLVIMASDWPLLTGGPYSEVVVSTDLTVLPKAKNPTTVKPITKKKK